MKSAFLMCQAVFFLCIVQNSAAQRTIPLYHVIPNSVASDVQEQADPTSARGKISHVTTPTLTIFLPQSEHSTGTAVIICPGGGYSYLVINAEGYDVARAFASKGIAAFVLKYRLPDSRIMADRSIGPLQDVQQAIKIVRDSAAKWGVDSAKVGIMGFSAGGHLASTLSTHYHHYYIDNFAKTNLRPDFSILVYPVISFQPLILHKGSKKALIGENADSLAIKDYSNELQVTPDTPPAFLVACSDDKVVPVENTLRYYEALHKNHVPAEMHIYEHGGHGFGMYNPTTSESWVESCFQWLQANHWL